MLTEGNRCWFRLRQIFAVVPPYIIRLCKALLHPAKQIETRLPGLPRGEQKEKK
jgi:hypothetical protein